MKVVQELLLVQGAVMILEQQIYLDSNMRNAKGNERLLLLLRLLEQQRHPLHQEL